MPESSLEGLLLGEEVAGSDSSSRFKASSSIITLSWSSWNNTLQINKIIVKFNRKAFSPNEPQFPENIVGASFNFVGEAVDSCYHQVVKGLQL